MRASVADGIGGQEGFPKFRVIREPDVSLRYFVGIRSRIPYDHDTLRGRCFIVSRNIWLEQSAGLPTFNLVGTSRM